MRPYDIETGLNAMGEAHTLHCTNQPGYSHAPTMRCPVCASYISICVALASPRCFPASNDWPPTEEP